MPIETFEDTVQNGQIRLDGGVSLPEQARVYVIVPDAHSGGPRRLRSPRLANPEKIGDFRKRMSVSSGATY